MGTSRNGKPKTHTDRVRELADYVEGLEDEISEVTHQVHTHVNLVDQTGRFAAVEAKTNPVNPRPKQDSLPEKVADAVTGVVSVAGMSWRHVTVLVVLAALAAFSAWLKFGR